MSTTDGTMPIGTFNEGSVEESQNKKKPTSTAAAVAATGAAAAGVAAAGVYAYNEHAAAAPEVEAIVWEEGDVEEEPVDEINETGSATTSTTGSAATNVSTTTPPANPVAPTEPVTPVTPTEPVTPTTPTEPVTPVTPVTPTEPVTPVTPVAPTEPVDPVINPQIEVAEDPDEIAEALIAVEEIDPEDFDGTQPFAFTEVETVYDIDGNATTEARYVDQEGLTGVMVDLDGDGVFDILNEDTGETYLVDDDSFLTVGDAEYDVETGYIAYDESQDIMIDDDPTDDIIDSEEFA